MQNVKEAIKNQQKPSKAHTFMFSWKEWKFIPEDETVNIDQLLRAKAQVVQESTFLQIYCFAVEIHNLIMELSRE